MEKASHLTKWNLIQDKANHITLYMGGRCAIVETVTLIYIYIYKGPFK